VHTDKSDSKGDHDQKGVEKHWFMLLLQQMHSLVVEG